MKIHSKMDHNGIILWKPIIYYKNEIKIKVDECICSNNNEMGGLQIRLNCININLNHNPHTTNPNFNVMNSPRYSS